jgi:DNA-binding CsgD family transcriptional regulator
LAAHAGTLLAQVPARGWFVLACWDTEGMPQGLQRDRMVGRDAEFAELVGLLDAAAAGRPAVALVGGDAGVGKTRLVTELAAEAENRGFAVLSGRCAELGDAVPYLPLADALRDARPGGALLEALAARPVLNRLLPDQTGLGADEPGLAKQQMFGAILGLLTDLAQTTPVLLVLEDLHWADASTRDLVTFLTRVLHAERLALVGTYRTDDLHRRHPLRPLLAELARLPGVLSLSLRPLADAAIAEHLSALAGHPIDAAAIGRMIERAEGNPYYAEELLAASASGTMLPAGLADLLLSRVERLSEPARVVLRAAAVTGRRADDELVRLASGLVGAEYDKAVREAVAHQLLVPYGERGYAFRHALLREAVYGDLMPGERTRLHSRLADLLSDETRLAEPGTAAELARHCLASHDVQGAFSASVRAGMEAERLAAPAEAHRHFDQALELWDRVSEPEKVSGTGRAELAFRSSLNAADGGDLAHAAARLRRLIGSLGETADADPALVARVHERLSYFLNDLNDDEGAMAAARAAVEALPAEPPRWERARALATYARALLFLPDHGPAAVRADEAMAAARAARAPWVEADALVTLGLISERRGRIAAAVDQFTRAHAQAVEAEVVGVELRAAFQLARVRLEQGDLMGAVRIAHQGNERAEATGLGLAPYGYDLQYLHYLAHYAMGDWDHAEQIARGFAARISGVPEARLSAMALFIAVARGSADVVAERCAWLDPIAERDEFVAYLVSGLVAEQALWRGEPEVAVAKALAAVRAIQQLYEGELAPQVIRPATIALAGLADSGHAADHRAQAQELLEIARSGAAWRPEIVLGVDGRGWLARAEAEFARAAGRNDPAAWRAVVAAFGPEFRYEQARSRWRLAEALAEAGDRESAREEWLAAVTVADELGARPLRERLADFGRRARLGAAVDGLSGGHHPLPALTDRERDVLKLIAGGRSNREIAAELFISPKTASVHVSHILAKLNAASRTEAAAIAHRANL